MPWTAEQATAHTHKADTPKKKRQWADVANSELAAHGDDARAIRAANSVVGHSSAMNAGGRARARARKDPPIDWGKD